jgi:PAS domain S-box-containing protein
LERVPISTICADLIHVGTERRLAGLQEIMKWLKEITQWAGGIFGDRKSSRKLAQLLPQAVEQSSQLIGIADADGLIAFVNTAFANQLGIPKGQLIGRHFSLFLSPENPAGLNQEIGQQSFVDGWRGECLAPRKDGTSFPVYLSSRAIRDKEGRTLGVIGIAQDMKLNRSGKTPQNTAQVRRSGWRVLSRATLAAAAVQRAWAKMSIE